MSRPNFIKLLNDKTPPGWTPENHGKRKPTKVETEADRETREYYERLRRLRKLKEDRCTCDERDSCGAPKLDCKCVKPFLLAESQREAQA
jgi:hypothetical protein